MTDDLERRLSAPPPASPLDIEGLRSVLARRAADEGVLDVGYGFVDSPLGPLTVIVSDRGLVRLSYAHEAIDEQLEDIAARISPRILESPDRTDAVRRQLDEYFAGDRRRFDVPIDWRLVRGFAGGVLRATSRIPFGAVSSYREVATEAGSPTRTARPETLWARTRSRSSCHATASCTRAGDWADIRAASSGRRTCCASRACWKERFRLDRRLSGDTPRQEAVRPMCSIPAILIASCFSFPARRIRPSRRLRRQPTRSGPS